MADSIKTGIGFLIPVGSLIGFIQSLLANDYINGIIFIIGGLMIWMLYILVVESTTPALMGNILIVFIVLLSLAVFLNYGLAQNIWGGYELKSDGSIIALLVLFFGCLIGMMFRQHLLGTPAPSLSTEDQDLVNKALGQSDNGGSSIIAGQIPSFRNVKIFVCRLYLFAIIVHNVQQYLCLIAPSDSSKAIANSTSGTFTL